MLPAKLAPAACAPGASSEKVTVLHVGDLHGHFHPYLGGNRSPFAVLRAFADRRRLETGGRVLFFDGGDALEKGSIAEHRSQGDATIHLLDLLGLDARTLGNHDFAWGLEPVLRLAASSAHDVLASNVKYDGGEAFRAKRSVVYSIGCAKIGVFGLVTNPYDESDDRFDGPYLGAFTAAHDPGDADRYVATAAEIVRELREEAKVDAVIAVDHLGLARDRAIVDSVPGLDLVVSAHDHVSIPGWVQGKHGAMVASGSFVGSKTEARVGEVVLEIDLVARSSRIVSAAQHRLDDLPDLDAQVQSEAERIMACFAPDADRPIGDLESPLLAARPDGWTPVLEAALRARFPSAHAFLYESIGWGGIVRGELPRGPITPQTIADFAPSERQKVGGPGFTAFVPVEVSAVALREICSAPLGSRLRRVCPLAIKDDATYELVVERRPLHLPQSAFAVVPKSWPKPPADESQAVEAYEVLTDWARARGKACRAIDRDVAAPCR